VVALTLAGFVGASAAGVKVLVFSQYVETLKWLSQAIDDVPTAIYSGEQSAAERDEVLTDRALVRCARREALRRPRDEGATARQQHVRHLPGAALGAALLDGKGGGSALAAGASNELGILVGPGRDLRRERYLLCRHIVDDNRK